MSNLVSQFLNDVAGGFFGNTYLRDFTHASKTFRAANYQNAPKFKFLFHVYFELNVPGPKDENGATANNFGILVKTVSLPNYNFATTELNQYNRKRIIQTKVKYNPVTITFHDDNRNLITSLWYKYFTYYYADATNPKVVFAGSRGGLSGPQIQGGGQSGPPTAADYNKRTQYVPSITGNDNWGYYGEPIPGVNDPNAQPVKVPFFKNITIFGLTQHNFIAYTLINPIISSFNHDTYDYEQGNGIMSNTMTLDYETVVYNQGAIDGQNPGNIMTGFGDKANYDTVLSPISTPGSNSNILGKGGLINSAGGVIEQLTTPGGNILGAIRTAGAVYNTFKNVNILDSLQSEIKQGVQNAIQNADNPTRQKIVDIPTYGATGSTTGTANAPPIAQQSPNPLQAFGQQLSNFGGDNIFSGVSTAISGALGTVARFAGKQNNVNGQPSSSVPPPTI